MRPLRLSLAALSAVLLFGACDSPSGGGQRDPARLDVVSGDLQPQATVGAELPAPLVVRVVDDRGRPVANQLVNFVVTAGGGSVFNGSALTDRDGEASERWTLGTAAGDTQRVEARVQDADAAVFRAVARPGPAASLQPVGAVPGTAPAGEPLADSAAVRAVDAYGNVLPGVQVAWTVTRGGGSVSPAQSATGPAGVAKAAWTLGPRVDSAHVLEATAGALKASFTVAATIPPSAVLVKVSGDNQSAVVGSTLPQPLVVRVQLADGRPVAGAGIAWTQPDPAVGTVTPALAVTDAQGEARATWTFTGGPPGTRTVAAGRTGSAPVFFTATALAPPPATLTVTAPERGTLAQPSVQVAATCGGGCVSIVAQVPASSLSGTTSVSGTLAFGGAGVRLDSVVFRARNAAGAETVAVRHVVVDPSGGFQRVAVIPGRVLDYLSGRVLWLDSTAAGRTLKIRTVSSGADATVGALAGTLGDFALHPEGAAYVETISTTSRVYAYRDGTRALLATAPGGATLRAEGAWMVYSVGGAVSLRDAGGTEVFSVTGGAGGADVGPNGTVAYSQNGQLVRRVLGGTPEVLFTPPGGLFALRTDGTAIGTWYTVSLPPFSDVALRAIGPGYNEDILYNRLSRGGISLGVGGGTVAGASGETGNLSVIRPGGSRFLEIGLYFRVVEVSAAGEVLLVRDREHAVLSTANVVSTVGTGIDRGFYVGSTLFLAIDGILVSRGAPPAARRVRRR
jgi:hypothetical protein